MRVIKKWKGGRSDGMVFQFLGKSSLVKGNFAEIKLPGLDCA